MLIPTSAPLPADPDSTQSCSHAAAQLPFAIEAHLDALRSLVAAHTPPSSTDSGVRIEPSPAHSLQSAIGGAYPVAAKPIPALGVDSGGSGSSGSGKSGSHVVNTSTVPSTTTTTSSSNVVMVDSPKPSGLADVEMEKWDDTARQAKLLADALRTARLRTPLGQAGLPEHLVALLALSLQASSPLSPSVAAAQVSLLRAMANLCIDHDENRMLLFHTGAVSALAHLLRTTLARPRRADTKPSMHGVETLALLRTLVGALLNLQLEQPHIRDAIFRDADALATLLGLVAADAGVYEFGSWRGLARGDGGSNGSSGVNAEEQKRIRLGNGVVNWAWRVVADVLAGSGVSDAVQDDVRAGTTAAASDDDQRMQSPGNPSGATEGAEEAPRRVEALLRPGMNGIEALLAPLRAYSSPVPGQGTIEGTHSGGASKEDDEQVVEQVAELVEDEVEVVTTACEALEELGVESVAFRRLCVERDGEVLRVLMDFLETGDLGTLPGEGGAGSVPSAGGGGGGAGGVEGAWAETRKAFSLAKAAVARAIVAVAAEDGNMADLFGETSAASTRRPWFIERIKSWMTAAAGQRGDLRSTALLSLGNLARSDAHCLALVQEHGILRSLLPLLQQNARAPIQAAATVEAASSPPSAGAPDMQTLHGVVGLLKNLSIPAANKRVIGATTDVIRTLRPLLSRSFDVAQPVQFGAVGVLKHLCAGVPENAAKVALPVDEAGVRSGDGDRVDRVASMPARGTDGSVLDDLLGLVARTDDVPTRMEATRIIVNLTRSLWANSTTATSRLSAKPGGAGAGAGVGTSVESSANQAETPSAATATTTTAAAAAAAAASSSSLPLPAAMPARSDSLSPEAIERQLRAARTACSLPDDVRARARAHVGRRAATDALAAMVRLGGSKYPVLVNEGVFALALIGSERSGALAAAASLVSATAPSEAGEDDDRASAGGASGSRGTRKRPSRRSTAESHATSTDTTTPAGAAAGAADAPSSQPPQMPSSSSSSSSYASPRRAVDMVARVLARRDARMPPAFASNACALVASLVEATASLATVRATAAVASREADVTEGVAPEPVGAREVDGDVANRRCSSPSPSLPTATPAAADDAAAGVSSDEAEGLAALREVLKAVRAPLLHLAAEGPEETKPQARATLAAVDAAMARWRPRSEQPQLLQQQPLQPLRSESLAS